MANAKLLKRIPDNLKELFEKIAVLAEKNRFNIYLVGGVVRDLILNRSHIDYDIVIEGDGIAFAEQLQEKLNLTLQRSHRHFGTARLIYQGYKIDIATAREEYYPYWGAMPKVKPAGIKQDLLRRDFTINAMAISLNKKNYGQLIDYYNGYNDLRQGIIRVLHDFSFLEDPTRILRAIRFEQRFSFHLDKHSYRLLRQAVSKSALKFIDEQRIRDELILLLKEENPHKIMRRIGQLVNFSFLAEDFVFDYKKYNLFIRIKKYINWYSQLSSRPVRGWVAYFIGLFWGMKLNQLEQILRDFGVAKYIQRQLLEAIKIKDKLSLLQEKSIKKSRVYYLLHGLTDETIVFFLAYFNNRIFKKNVEVYINDLSKVSLHCRGKDLKDKGFKPYHLYGRAMQMLLAYKIDHNIESKEEELAYLRRLFKRWQHIAK